VHSVFKRKNSTPGEIVVKVIFIAFGALLSITPVQTMHRHLRLRSGTPVYKVYFLKSIWNEMGPSRLLVLVLLGTLALVLGLGFRLTTRML
jgi:hypothetical protein